ncbi:MAG: AAA family ATPase [Tyzzerella sp.]|nr:AAA family ATPase [Tyzzerella sp.]
MKIRELYLKNFGKFSDEKIVLKDGINLFYGENESGKTTVHTFIKSMLFGLERGRGRASVNDTFSLYEPWENPNYYSGTLRFESGGKHFCLERTFDKYSKSASLICEDDGEEFSLVHGDLEMILGGLDASTYENTIAIGQMKVEPNQTLAAELQNFATNYYSTGNSDIDLDGALNLLNKKKKEVEKDIRVLLQEKQQKRYEIEQEAAYVWRDIHKTEDELDELEKKIEAAKEKQEEQESMPCSKWRIHPSFIAVMLLALIIVFLVFSAPWNYMITIVIALAEGLFVWNRLKDGKKIPQEELVAEAKEALAKLLGQKERMQAEMKEKQIQYGNLQERLSELEEAGDDYKSQTQKKNALELATEQLLLLSKDVHQELSVELNRKASSILSEITGGKYSMLLIDEKLKMQLYTGEKKIGIEQVSRGTIEQIYFALRMAASEILFEEEYPVILDDTFVFYDDARLENTLRWLVKNKKQVLLFTCQKREGEILKRLK